MTMQLLTSPEACVDLVVDKVGKTINLGTPLAAGKPNHLLNAFYRRAKLDPDVSLTIYTALTLELPKGHSDLEKRFLEPMVERVFGNYPDLEYELDRVAGTLPDNVRVIEFYFPAGKFTHNPVAQRDYISSNYTHVARDLLDRGLNVLASQVAWGEVDGERKISLSCNPDTALDIMDALDDRDDVMFLAQTNGELPFMYGDAVVDPEHFDFVVHEPALDYRVFGPPKMSVSDADYMIGMNASTLIRDGGELQIGIGSLADSIVYGMVLRQDDNPNYRRVLDRLGILERNREVIDRVGELDRFDEGLFAATEMLVDVFMYLYQSGIIKRRVYDDLPLQRLLNANLIGEQITPTTLSLLAKHKAIHVDISREDFEYLTYFGVFRNGLTYADGLIITRDGTRIPARLNDDEAFKTICEQCLGDHLKHGAVIHAGFFLGPQVFYQWLRDLPEEERRLINMRSVTRVNQLYGHEALDRLQRRSARFVNTGMMVTMNGAVVSDALEDGTVISGVGGQYNFVSMAHALPDGRSILQVRSTHLSDGDVRSSILWNYGHVTIPRHLRDIVVTEYGIADLRGRTDEEIVQSLLEVTDSRFQHELMEQAKHVGKLAHDYAIPELYRNNTPDSYGAVMSELRAEGLFKPFPFGTDLTEEEIIVGGALRRLKGRMESRFHALEAVADAVAHGAVHDDTQPYLERMGLDDSHGLKETLYKRLLSAELRHDPRVGAKEDS
jgi:acyl-CoA hydrolase